MLENKLIKQLGKTFWTIAFLGKKNENPELENKFKMTIYLGCSGV